MKSSFEWFMEQLEEYLEIRETQRAARDRDEAGVPREVERVALARLEELFERAVKEAATEYNEDA